MAKFERSVTLVNRVRGADGKPIPWQAMFDGERIAIEESISVPVGVARILIQQSMYKMEPDTSTADYRLGCTELGCPIDPLTEAEVNRSELIDRDLLSPDRKLGAKDRFGRTYTAVKRAYRPPRTIPVSVTDPGEQDGVFPGQYGEVKMPVPHN
jgi:hypothetical protein